MSLASPLDYIFDYAATNLHWQLVLLHDPSLLSVNLSGSWYWLYGAFALSGIAVR